MNPVKPFPLRPLAQALKLLSIAPFLMLSEQAFARIIDGGRPVVIDGSAAPEAYTLLNNAQLTANGATTNEILVQTGSHVSLNGSTVTATGTSDGVRLSQSSADIDRTTITSSGTGLSLLYNLSTGVASQATVTDSTISGGDRGVAIGSLGELDLTRTTVVGNGPNGVGIQMGNASVAAQASTIVGSLNGINIIASGDASQPRSLTLDGTVVQGQSGTAIVVNDFGTPTSAADILIGNGSTLVGGNGVML